MRTIRRALFNVVPMLLIGGCTQTATIDVDNPDLLRSSSSKALLAPSGPDLTIDQGRLQSSIRVLTNQVITQDEVLDGCAVSPVLSGRTLVRFDVKTPNNGPGDIDVGHVTCSSTNPSASCNGVDCSLNRPCCANGTQRCVSSNGPQYNAAFEFNVAHGHVHMKSFANYRLLTPTGVVAAAGHKQSFCMMDMEDITSGSCRPLHFNSPTPFACGTRQGIHAGCADVYAADLPCGFVDVTDVPGGDYKLEVTMDPLDLINESNESNNTVVANVRVPPSVARPDAGQTVDAGPQNTQAFLVRDGVGDLATANTYYAANRPGFQPGSFSLAQWQAEFVGAATVKKALYRNTNELAFWREMSCTAAIGRGTGGCWVTNWTDVDDSQRGVPNLGTVAMNLSAAGFVQFWVFSPGGVIQPFAILDSEGNKFVPQLCTNCHAGDLRAGSNDLGSIFREFEPSMLQPRPGITQAQAEQEWFDLNQVIRGANQNIRAEPASPFGTNHAKAAMESYVTEIYSQTSPPISRPINDPAHLPASWKVGSSPQDIAAKAEIWKKLVNPYCMTCHRTNTLDYANYSQWTLLAADSNGRLLLRRYIENDPQDPHRLSLAFMPQSKVAFDNLRSDAEALISVDQWLNQATNQAPVARLGTLVASAEVGDTLSASAAASSDGNLDPITFRWDVVSGPAVTFFPSATSSAVSFVVPPVSAVTPLVLRVRVTDSRGAFSDAQATISLRPTQGPRLLASAADLPINIPDNNAAGISSSIQVADNKRITELKVTVDLTHTWIGDLKVTLTGPGTTRVLHDHAGRNIHDIHQTYVVPEAVGLASAGVWKLSVTDNATADVGTLQGFKLDFGVGADVNPPDAGSANRNPLANAGPDLNVNSGTQVDLDGTGSTDPDGDPLTFQWTQTLGPTVSLRPSTSGHVTFTAPVVAAVTVIELKLSLGDGRGGTATDTARIAVTPVATVGQVLISEVMVNPAFTDANHEWVKIWNGTGQTLDLSQFSIGFGKNPAWVNSTSLPGGTMALVGMLPPGRCLIVGGPVSDAQNAGPVFAPSASYGVGLARDFSGSGLNNPATNSVAAVALFNTLTPNASTRPVDIVTYHQTTVTPPASHFLGPSGAVAPASLITGSDGAAGRSFRRTSAATWEITGSVSANDGALPSPNNCSPIP